MVIDTEDDIKKLNQGALSIASTTILSPLAFSIALIVEDAFWQTSRCHAFAPCQERPDNMIKHLRITMFSHSVK